MKLTYYCLAISILFALFNRNRTMVYACIAITGLASLYENVMTLTGAIYFTALAILTFLYFNYLVDNPRLKQIVFILIAILLAGFVLHDIPGFTNQLIVDKFLISAASRPCSIWLKFDKVFAALVIYALSPLIIKESKLDWLALKQTILIVFTCIVVILGPAILSGYVRLDPKIPAILPIWVVSNFLFVIFSEEVIFRGFLQTTLKDYLPNGWKYTLLAIIMTSIIFGMAHYKGGITFMCLAAIAGLFYGYAYDRTKRILCAMLVHLSLNLTHFLAFTYPC
jgi:uncharacterized protein